MRLVPVTFRFFSYAESLCLCGCEHQNSIQLETLDQCYPFANLDLQAPAEYAVWNNHPFRCYMFARTLESLRIGGFKSPEILTKGYCSSLTSRPLPDTPCGMTTTPHRDHERGLRRRARQGGSRVYRHPGLLPRAQRAQLPRPAVDQ